MQYTAIDVFAGCGGLSLGFEQAGWLVDNAYDIWTPAITAYRQNLKGTCHRIRLWKTFPFFPKADLVIGGPPCQPFSKAGKQIGKQDPRNGMDIFIQAIRSVKPRYAVMENVPSLATKHRDYFMSVIGQFEQFGYTVSHKLLKASDYGCPQARVRLFVVLHQGDFEFPAPTTAKKPLTVADALPRESFDTSTAEQYPKLVLTPGQDAYIARYEQRGQFKARDLHPEKPARTLTCRNLAGCTSDMIRIKLPNGQRRQLTVPEAAVLSTFPPDYFPETLSRNEAMKCIGNAVPPRLAKVIAEELLECIADASEHQIKRQKKE